MPVLTYSQSFIVGFFLGAILAWLFILAIFSYLEYLRRKEKPYKYIEGTNRRLR